MGEDLISYLLRYDIKDRVTIDEVLEHPAFDQFKQQPEKGGPVSNEITDCHDETLDPIKYDLHAFTEGGEWKGRCPVCQDEFTSKWSKYNWLCFWKVVTCKPIKKWNNECSDCKLKVCHAC